MSLRDLLPEGSLEEIEEGIKTRLDAPQQSEQGIMVRCPHCGTMHLYRTEDSFRPFCSEKCKLLDLGQWADDEMVIEGPELLDDDDAEYAGDLAQKAGYRQGGN